MGRPWGAFYEAFEPDRARAYIKRINFCYTPKHGSWLNVAECELSCLTSQCLSDRRIGELTELQTEIAAWSDKTNAKQRGVDWQFRIEDARPGALAPSISSLARGVRLTGGGAGAKRRRRGAEKWLWISYPPAVGLNTAFLRGGMITLAPGEWSAAATPS